MLSNPDLMVNGLLVFFAVTSFISNIYWFRLATVLTSLLALILYFVNFEHYQWYVVVIACVIVVANLYKIWRIRKSHGHLHFSENERILHQKVFSDLNAQQYMALMRIAVWRDVPIGEVLIKQGEKVACLSLIFSGIFKVDVGKNHYIEIRNGQFIGEMSYVSGNPGSGTVIAEENSLIVEWPQQQLKALVNENSVIGNCIQALFNADLMKKLGD